MIKAVIFDMDGTLVDSVDNHASSIQDAFLEFGKHFSHGAIRAKIGMGMDNLLPEFLSKEEIDKFGEALSKRKGEIFKETYLPLIRGFPKVRELFEKLLEEGKSVGLASSAEKEELAELKKRAGIEDLIQEETSSDDAENSKPAPDIFEAAFAKLKNISKAEVLCVGDTPYDIEAASKAGLQTIAVRCGGFPDHLLKGAIAIYNDPAEILSKYHVSAIAS